VSVVVGSRGRKSSAERVLLLPGIGDQPPPIEPPSHLTRAERQLFREIVRACPPSHFRPADAPVLATFVTATLVTRSSSSADLEANPERAATWEKLARLQASLAGKLRICPSSRIDAKAAGREQVPPKPAPWELAPRRRSEEA
jgi:hypothetical protein